MIEYLLISHYPAQGPAQCQRPFGADREPQGPCLPTARLITFILPHPGPRYKSENVEHVDILTSRRLRGQAVCLRLADFAARAAVTGRGLGKQPADKKAPEG